MDIGTEMPFNFLKFLENVYFQILSGIILFSFFRKMDETKFY